jgi:hypothetical protein
MEFLLAYCAGLLTLINPCVLLVLPNVLVGAMLFFKVRHIIEAWVLSVMPIRLQGLSVAI